MAEVHGSVSEVLSCLVQQLSVLMMMLLSLLVAR